MMNIQGIMKQAQMMQKRMEETQGKIAQQEVEGSSGAGMVKIVMNGKYETKKVSIDKSLIVAEEADVLEDLLVAALNDARSNADKLMEDGMKEVTGGLNLGGLKLPF